jgi:hypothetical protein
MTRKIAKPLPAAKMSAAMRMQAIEVRVHCAEQLIERLVGLIEKLMDAPRQPACGKSDLRLVR